MRYILSLKPVGSDHASLKFFSLAGTDLKAEEMLVMQKAKEAYRDEMWRGQGLWPKQAAQ